MSRDKLRKEMNKGFECTSCGNNKFMISETESKTLLWCVCSECQEIYAYELMVAGKLKGGNLS